MAPPLAARSVARAGEPTQEILDRALTGEPLSEADAVALIECPDRDLDDLIGAAGDLRDRGKGRHVTYSRKVFLPVTNLCRDRCTYCTFRKDPGDPDKCPVGDLHKVFSTPETLAKVYEGCRSAGIGCIECKSWAADALVQILNPIQQRRASFTSEQVDEILKDGSDRARARAEQTMCEVRAAMQMTVPGC